MKRLILAMALSCLHAANATPPANERSQERAHQRTAAVKSNVPDHVGSATMLQDRTIPWIKFAMFLYLWGDL